jgi:hypothetical protein
MDKSDMVRRVSMLPQQFASRLDGHTNHALRSMMLAADYSALIELLISELIEINDAVTLAECRELRELLNATHMPIDQIEM